MNNLLIALLIGLIAGIIDVIPMIARKLDKTSCISAFVHYLVLGLIIPFVNIEIYPWLKGALIAILTALPIMILVYQKDKSHYSNGTLLSDTRFSYRTSRNNIYPIIKNHGKK